MDVTSEKHLNPLGSKVQIWVMTSFFSIFYSTAITSYMYGDLNDTHVAGSVIVCGLGALISLVFLIHEFMEYFREPSVTAT
jgi:hypothetical protein